MNPLIVAVLTLASLALSVRALDPSQALEHLDAGTCSPQVIELLASGTAQQHLQQGSRVCRNSFVGQWDSLPGQISTHLTELSAVLNGGQQDEVIAHADALASFVLDKVATLNKAHLENNLISKADKSREFFDQVAHLVQEFVLMPCTMLIRDFGPRPDLYVLAGNAISRVDPDVGRVASVLAKCVAASAVIPRTHIMASTLDQLLKRRAASDATDGANSK